MHLDLTVSGTQTVPFRPPTEQSVACSTLLKDVPRAPMEKEYNLIFELILHSVYIFIDDTGDRAKLAKLVVEFFFCSKRMEVPKKPHLHGGCSSA